jgi:uncharacterized protein (TIGR02001 family)
MRILFTAAAATGALIGAAHAEPTFSGNVALTTDYTFRGVSQTNEGPAVQGGFDYTNDIYYAGVWASNVDFGGADGSLEVDLYAGLKPTFGAVNTDFGVIGYFYPNASDHNAELDYAEVYAKASISPAEGWTIGGAVFVSPEFTGETGTGVYAEVGASYAFDSSFSVSGAFGQQSAEDADFDPRAGAANVEDKYTTWNVGLTVTPQDSVFKGFSADLRYVDTDIDGDLAPAADERVVLSIKRSF